MPLSKKKIQNLTTPFLQKGVNVCTKKGVNICTKKGVNMCTKKGVNICHRERVTFFDFFQSL